MCRNIKTCLVLAVVLFSSLFAATQVLAAGFQLFNELSAKTMGNSAAMSARYDAAELAWFNPAGSAMMARPQISGGGALIFPSMKLKDAEISAPALPYDGNDDPNMKHIAYPVPYLYGAMPFMDKFGVSLSINSPYGLTTEWDNNWMGKYVAHYTNLSTIFITPALAYRPIDWLSLSAGVQFAYADAEMRKAIPIIAGTSYLGDAYTTIKGHDWGQGFVLSALATPFEDWSFGISYHSYIHFTIDGHGDYDLPTLNPLVAPLITPKFQRSAVELPLDLPPSLAFAVSTTMLQDFRFSAEILWTGWSTYSNLKFHYLDTAPGSTSPGVVTVEKKWEDVISLHFGIEYYLNDQWTFRVSYAWDDSPIDDDWRDPSLPTNDRNVFGFGVGYTWNHLTVDAAYTYVNVENSKPGDKVEDPLGRTLSGKYEGDAHIANLQFSWTF